MSFHHSPRKIGLLVSALGLMGAFYAWVAYASEIENEVNALVAAISKESGQKGDNKDGDSKRLSSISVEDQSAQQMLIQNRQTVEDRLNTAIHADMFAETTMNPADRLLTQHLSNYCSAEVEQGEVCPSDPLLVFGDIKVSSLLSGSVYNKQRADAANAFLETLFTILDGSGVANFQSNKPITAATLMSDPVLKEKYVQALNDEALLSVVRQSFSEMIAKRMPNANGAAVSEMQLMEKNAVQRFMSSDWSNKVSGMSGGEIQAELALMQAYQLWMNYQSYRQMERVEALLAATLLRHHRSAKTGEAIIKKNSSVGADAQASSTEDLQNVDSGSLEGQ